MSTRPLQFFGIGAQKSGTTWLYAYLKEHPQVFMPEIKELNYFWALSERREMHEAERQLAAMNRIMEGHPKKGPGMRKRIGDLGTLMAALSGRLDYRAIFDAAPEGTRAAT